MPVSIPGRRLFKPRPDQWPLWKYLQDGGKRAFVAAHRRWGKDEIALNWACEASQERVGNYWHMLPEAAQARKAIWEAVNEDTGLKRIDEAFPQEIREGTRNNDMVIRFKNGSTWQVVGSDNYNSLVGSSPVGIVFSEWALADPQAWAYLRPILRRNRGWALFITTPRGRNHAATMYEGAKEDPEWGTFLISAESSPVFTAEELEQELKEYQRDFGKDDGESRFRQEYYCDFNVSVVGSYYGRLLTEAEEEGRITRVPHNPGLKVDTWWDLGASDTTSIWFVQQSFQQIAVVDYYAGSSLGLDHYANVLNEKQAERKFVYGRHLWPHDGSHLKLTTKGARHLNEMMGDLGVQVEVQPVGDVLTGINRCRQIIPVCWFDREHCAEGIEGLRQYRREWDDERRTFLPKPMHDWASHPADAFRTGAMATDIMKEQRVVPRDRYARQFRKGRRPGTWMGA